MGLTVTKLSSPRNVRATCRQRGETYGFTFQLVLIAAACVAVHAEVCHAGRFHYQASRPQSKAGEAIPGFDRGAAEKAIESALATLKENARSLRLQEQTTNDLGIDALLLMHRETVLPRFAALQSAIKRCHNQADDALTPLTDAELAQAEIVRRQRKEIVVLMVSRPEKCGDGWLGRDSASEKQVYIETKYPPERIGQMLIYGPIQGEFVQDGSISGQNAFGAAVSVPRFIDPPADDSIRLNKIREQHLGIVQRYRESVSDATKGTLDSIQYLRKQIIARCLELPMTESQLFDVVPSLTLPGESSERDVMLAPIHERLFRGEWTGDTDLLLYGSNDAERAGKGAVHTVLAPESILVRVGWTSPNGIRREVVFSSAGHIKSTVFEQDHLLPQTNITPSVVRIERTRDGLAIELESAEPCGIGDFRSVRALLKRK